MPKLKKNMRFRATPLLHFAAWMIFYLSPFLEFPLNIVIAGDRAIMHTILTLSLAAVFYINFFWLIPKYFKVRKFLLYFYWPRFSVLPLLWRAMCLSETLHIGLWKRNPLY